MEVEEDKIVRYVAEKNLLISELLEEIVKLREELGFYRWFDEHIEQRGIDDFYDMRFGNSYETKAGCRCQYNQETY
tara:strand:+ start:266 stop:493 length:228 start_codon:yes stop_codon:yes gene_type:complete